MIYTCTLNPSLDYFIELDSFQLNGINKVKTDHKVPGGKGINVSRVLRRLGHDSQALGFVGGFTGDFIQSSLRNEGIGTNFVPVDGDTRINIKVKSEAETEINGLAPVITEEKLNMFYQTLSELQKGDLLVLSGSVPSSLPNTMYKEIMDFLKAKQVMCIVDTTKTALTATFGHRPFLIKPNHHELGDLFEKKITSAKEAVPLAKALIEKGVQNIVVSMAGMGALYVNETTTFLASVPEGEVRNSVGAGDSLVGGFIARYIESNDCVDAFRYGVAAGSATAFSIDLCTKETQHQLLPQVNLTKL